MPRPSLIERRQTAEGRRYTLATPTGDSSRENGRPLIVSLHYGGPVSPWYGEGLLTGVVEPALRDLEAIIVAPDCNAGLWDNDQSESEVLALMDALAEEFDLDPDRVLLTGYSLGGIGTWHIAGRNQDRFKAALPMASVPPDGALSYDWRIPIRILHGRNDDHFPWRKTAEAADHLLTRGHDAELILIEGVGHYDTGLYVNPLRQSIPWIQQAWIR